MGKKSSPPRPPIKTEFRESDFAGMPPHDKAQLSGSLNRLSEQLANTRQLLQDIEQGAPVVAKIDPLMALSPPEPAAPEVAPEPQAELPPRPHSTPTPTDDGTPVPP
jgi:hypothetical protein